MIHYALTSLGGYMMKVLKLIKDYKKSGRILYKLGCGSAGLVLRCSSYVLF